MATTLVGEFRRKKGLQPGEKIVSNKGRKAHIQGMIYHPDGKGKIYISIDGEPGTELIEQHKILAAWEATPKPEPRKDKTDEPKT